MWRTICLEVRQSMFLTESLLNDQITQKPDNMKKRITHLLLIVLLGFTAKAQVIDIDSARTLRRGSVVTVSGVVTNGNELGPIRYFQDPTAGLCAYSGSFVANIKRGDSVTFTGELTYWDALMGIQPVDSYKVHINGATLPTPKLITPSQAGEYLEAQLVRINDAGFLAKGVFAGDYNYMISSGGDTISVRVNRSSNLVGTPIPSGEVDLLGIVSQYYYDETTDTTDGYQILLRDLDDIIPTSNISFTSPVHISNISTSGFDLSWTTDSAGTTEIFYGSTDTLGNYMNVSGTSIVHSISITGASPSEMFYVQAFSVRGGDTAFSPIEAYITQSLSSGEMIAYFSSSVDHSVATTSNAIHLPNLIDDTLIQYINRATLSIDLSIFSYNKQNISNITAALNSAYTRGVDIRIIHDGTVDNVGFNGLDSNINIIASPSASAYPSDTGIMNNKFVVFDGLSSDPNGPIVWTGSTNWTDHQINTDPNSVIIIQDASLAKAYITEFEEMWGSNTLIPDSNNWRFGHHKIDNTPHEFVIDGKRVECYFSPSERVNSRIVSAIETANFDVVANTTLITRSDIGYAIEEKHQNSVNTQVLVNNEALCSEAVVTSLRRLDTNFRNYTGNGILHHKALIIDHANPESDPILLVGSQNWSNIADLFNDENILIIHDSTIANIYYQEFYERWKQSSQAGVFEIYLGPDTTLCEESEIILSPGYNYDAYLWSTGETTRFITVDSSGVGIGTKEIWVRVNQNGKFASDTILISFKDCDISIKELNKVDVKITPNPATDMVFVNLNSLESDHVQLCLFDLGGRLVWNKDFAGVSKTQALQVDVSNIAAGTYFLNIANDKRIITKKIVVR